MKLDVRFSEQDRSFETEFGSVHNVSDGGYERGYAAGYEEGNTEGYAKGHTDGVEQGYAAGYETGNTEGYAKGHEDGVKSACDEIMGKITTGALTEVYDQVSTTIKDYAYPNFPNLTSASFPNAITTGNSAFRNNPKLVSVNFPKAETVGSYAFHTSTTLESLDLPMVTTIMDGAFGYCSKLKALILRAETVCSLRGTTNVFVGTPIAKGTGFIYVPNNLVEQYKTATNWSTYATQIKPIGELEVTEE